MDTALRRFLRALDSNSGAGSLFGEVEERTAGSVMFSDSDGSHPTHGMSRVAWIFQGQESDGGPGVMQQLGRHTFNGGKMVRKKDPDRYRGHDGCPLAIDCQAPRFL